MFKVAKRTKSKVLKMKYSDQREEILEIFLTVKNKSFLIVVDTSCVLL